MPWGPAFVLLAGLLPLFAARTTTAAESVAMPFAGGSAVSIIQGYNGGTHQGRSRYGLDLVLADGGTSGAEVVSPIEGTVTYAQAPKTGNGCMAVTFRDGSYSVMLCHLYLNRTFSRGESIARGQPLGTVGPAGTVGNNGAPHVHLELHRGSSLSSPVPFGEPDGLALEGVSLPALGARNEYGNRSAIVSTNRAGSAVVASTTTRLDETTQTLSARSDPSPLTAASLSSLGRTIDPSSPSSAAPAPGSAPESASAPASLAPPAATANRAAYVRGTDACLNVRKSPTKTAALVGCLPEGAAVVIVDGPTKADGFEWYRIERAGTLKEGGWVVGTYLS